MRLKILFSSNVSYTYIVRYHETGITPSRPLGFLNAEKKNNNGKIVKVYGVVHCWYRNVYDGKNVFISIYV